MSSGIIIGGLFSRSHRMICVAAANNNSSVRLKRQFLLYVVVRFKSAFFINIWHESILCLVFMTMSCVSCAKSWVKINSFEDIKHNSWCPLSKSTDEWERYNSVRTQRYNIFYVPPTNVECVASACSLQQNSWNKRNKYIYIL